MAQDLMHSQTVQTQISPANWSVASLAQWAQGHLVGASNVICNGISTDSRSTRPGDLYIALVGERFDGHDFIVQAIENGATAVMVSRQSAVDCPMIIVSDTRIGLGLLARNYRLSLGLKALIAVTGSNGKTTVKTLLAHILQTLAPTWATQGNLNNDFGVPRTLLQLRPEHQYAVIEMGANHRHEINYLTRLACPNVALITLAAGAHLEGFGSLQGVIDTKGEIFNGLADEGVGIINTDSPGFAQWQAQLADKQCLTFGRAPNADVCLLDAEQTADGIAFNLSFNGETQAVSMPILGVHNAMNAAAAVAVCLAIGLNWSQIAPGLQSFSGVAGRLQTYRLAQGGLLIDDSYNANPSSVKAAIDTLVAIPGRAVLCLGALAELGEDSLKLHQALGEYARQRGVDVLLTFGAATQATQAGFALNRPPDIPYQDQMALAMQVQQLLQTSQSADPLNILVKGSRSAQMDRVVAAILERNDHARLS